MWLPPLGGRFNYENIRILRADRRLVPKNVVDRDDRPFVTVIIKVGPALRTKMHTPATEPQSLPIDPVCGMEVDPSTDLRTDHKGTTYFFCHPHASAVHRRSRILPEPASEPSQHRAAYRRAIYTCPMHPEVRQDGPGACPKCGMALEPRVVTLDEGPNPELIDMTRRFWIAAVLGLPVMLFAMAEWWRRTSCTAESRALAELVQLAARDRRSCSGRAGRFSSAAGRRSSIAAPTCSR